MPQYSKLHQAQATVAFTKRLNVLFDCLNLQRQADLVKAGPGQLCTVKESLAWLDKWCIYVSSLTQQQQFFLSDATCRALRITLQSTIRLTESLLSSGFHYVLTGKFGQDPLEKFFGISRHIAGDGGQPTVQQFLHIYRMLCVNNLVRPPARSNVSGQGPQLLLNLRSLFQSKAAVKSQVQGMLKLILHWWQIQTHDVVGR